MMQIRDAVETDFEEITAIYNDVLTHSTAIYNDRPATLEDRIAWWRARLDQHHPVLVATDGQHVCGFASFGDFRSWPGYRFTVEGTVHVASQFRGLRVGSLLLKFLIEKARLAGKHSMIAGVDSENTASLAFLERYGFRRIGYLPEVGYKFDRFLNLVLSPVLAHSSGHSGSSHSGLIRRSQVPHISLLRCGKSGSTDPPPSDAA